MDLNYLAEVEIDQEEFINNLAEIEAELEAEASVPYLTCRNAAMNRFNRDFRTCQTRHLRRYNWCINRATRTRNNHLGACNRIAACTDRFELQYDKW